MHSDHTHPALAHHFDDLEQQKDASTLGMWVFLTTEIMFFGGLFLVYIIYRSTYSEAFVHASNILDVNLGLFNTIVLIASSLTMAMAVYSAQTNKRAMLIAFLVATIILGATFLGVKSIEYHHKYVEHLIPGPYFAPAAEHELPREGQLFFSLYFAMTGLHAFHMIIGIGLLSMLIINTFRGKFSKEYNSPVEIVGLYWHFVDIVWIFLFPLLYLLGRHELHH